MLAIVIILSFTVGRYPVSVSELLSCTAYKIKELFAKLFKREIEPYSDMTSLRVLFNIRVPRVLLACLVGCSLSAAGASYQGVFQNPMAAPDILGASSGAAFGAALAIVLGGNRTAITVSAFAFSLITVALVIFVSERAKGKRVLSLILGAVYFLITRWIMSRKLNLT